MSQSNLIRWIECADARQVSEAAMFDRGLNIAEHHYLHLGTAIAKVPQRLRHGVTRESLTAIGCHALAYLRRTGSGTQH